MNSRRPLSLLSLLMGSLMLLSACNWATPRPSEDGNSSSGTENAGAPDSVSTEDRRTHDQAIAEQDPSTCDEIQNAAYKKECTDRVLFMQASAKTDASICTGISDPAEKQSCTDNVSFNLAGEKLDEKICLHITNSAQKKLCQESVKGMKDMKKAQAAGKLVLPPDSTPESQK